MDNASATSLVEGCGDDAMFSTAEGLVIHTFLRSHLGVTHVTMRAFHRIHRAYYYLLSTRIAY